MDTAHREGLSSFGAQLDNVELVIDSDDYNDCSSSEADIVNASGDDSSSSEHDSDVSGSDIDDDTSNDDENKSSAFDGVS